LVLISNIGGLDISSPSNLVRSLIGLCVEALNRKCSEQRYRLHGVRDPVKCRNKLVHMLEPCVKVYQLIYRSSCERRVDYYTGFAHIRSVVGHIMSTPGFSIDKIVSDINNILREYSCKEV